MNTYKGLRELLDSLVEVEEQFSAWYEHTLKTVTDSYCRARLEKLYDNHKNNIEILKSINVDDYGADEWVQFTPVCSPGDCIPETHITETTGVEEIAQTILAFDRSLAAMYRDIANKVVSDSHKDLFESLGNLKQQQILSINQYLQDWR